MQEVLDLLKNGAKKHKRKIVLPETTDERVLQAAHTILAEEIADIILVGDTDTIKKQAAALKLNLDKAEIVDPLKSSCIQKLADHYYERRKHKDATPEKSIRIMQEQTIYTGAALVGAGLADGMVAGCITETAKVIKSAIYCVGLEKGISLVSSYFMMVVPNKKLGENGVLFFADCGVNPNPSSEQLADIAKCTADNFKLIIGKEPKLGMLSFSTKGSAAHPDVDKVTSALSLAKLKYPDLKIDGEFQVDAAVVPSVGERKAPGSEIAGKANILIFPDLDAGNIGYKLVQRFANAFAFGPILQGLAKPVNDLSRGATAEDIVNVVQITAMSVRG